MSCIFLPLENTQHNKSSQNNTIDRYLNQKIDFTGKKISLSYIHFYDTFHNISRNNNNRQLKYMFKDEQFEVEFPDGTYSYKDFDNFLHFVMKKNSHYEVSKESGIEIYPINIIVNTVYSCLSVRINENYALIIETEEMSRFLGINIGKYNADFNSQKIPDITMGFDVCFVHCNIVDNSVIPEYNTVIFTCPINKNVGQNVNITPNEKRFLNCSNANTQNIKIWLTNQDGKIIYFVENKWGIGLDIV